MTTNSRTSRRLAAGSLAAAAVAVLAAANPAAGTSSAYAAACSFDPASLPRTADAAQGWYDQCRSQQPFYATKAGLPAEAAQDWYVQRKTGHVFVTRTSSSTSDKNETTTTDRPANWRQLMVELPDETPTDRPANWRQLMDEVPDETPTADRPANWRQLTVEVPESPQLLGRPAPSDGAEQDGFRNTFESGAGHPAWTGNRSPNDTEQARERVRATFERGVGPGQSLYSPGDQG
jgi:hypothetical protein